MSFVFFTAIAATPWTLHPYFLPLYIYSALLHWLYWALELDIHFGVLKCSIWKHPQNTGLEWSHINSHLVFTCCHIAIFFSVVLGIEGKHERRWVPLDMVLSSGMYGMSVIDIRGRMEIILQCSDVNSTPNAYMWNTRPVHFQTWLW